MSHKTSPARRAAFFAALRETGNQTLACERAKVSRSWVQLQRDVDPQFKADVVTAVAEARASLANAPIPDLRRGGQARSTSGRKPPRGWGHLDGEELVVKGTGGSGGGKRVQIARARLKQWTPRVEARFLQALGATCNVKAACAEVGMSAAGAYAHRKRWPLFAELWKQAIAEGYARIEIALLDNACNLFSASELPPEAPLAGMDVAQAIRVLHMHKNAVKGLGKAPGLQRLPTVNFGNPAIRASIARKVEAIRNARTIPPEVRAADARTFAARRG